MSVAFKPDSTLSFITTLPVATSITWLDDKLIADKILLLVLLSATTILSTTSKNAPFLRVILSPFLRVIKLWSVLPALTIVLLFIFIYLSLDTKSAFSITTSLVAIFVSLYAISSYLTSNT